jgi:hypothetical protein
MPLYIDRHYAEGATKSGVAQAHDKAHGLVPNEIIEVDTRVVEGS